MGPLRSVLLFAALVDISLACGGIGGRNFCTFSNWNSWSPCSRSCGGGTRTRDRTICCRPEWTPWQCRNECGVRDSDFVDHGSCNTICFNGGQWTGSRCQCTEEYSGSCCDCRVNCGFPGNIENGRVHGTNFEFGDSVTYSCNNFFNLTDGDFRRTCGRPQGSSSCVGVWSGNQPRCAYAHSCNSEPCFNGATCVNELDGYNCNCVLGWGGNNCQLDILPPSVKNCRDDPLQHYTDQLTTHVTWEEPYFYDPFGNDVTVTSNFMMATDADLPWGDNEILYTGRKENNALTTDCSFDEVVDPFPCEQPPVPVNGALVCTNWNRRFARVCANFCNQKWTVHRSRDLGQMMVCGASGSWSPDIGGYNCTKRRLPEESLTHFNGACDIAAVEIRDMFLDLLVSKRSPFKLLCDEFPEECHTDNVVIYC